MTASSIPHPPAPGHQTLQDDSDEDDPARHGQSSAYIPERDGEAAQDKYSHQGAEEETEKKEEISSLTTLHVSWTARLYCSYTAIS